MERQIERSTVRPIRMSKHWVQQTLGEEGGRFERFVCARKAIDRLKDTKHNGKRNGAQMSYNCSHSGGTCVFVVGASKDAMSRNCTSKIHIKSHRSTSSATDFPVSRMELVWLLANTSGATSRKMCSVARRRNIRPVECPVARSALISEVTTEEAAYQA